MSHLTDEILWSLAEGEGSPAESAETDAHLVSCETCRAELKRRRSVLTQLAGLPRQAALTRSSWPEVAARIQQGNVAPTSARAHLQASTLALIAAGIALFAGGIAIGRTTVGRSSSEPVRIATATRTEEPRGAMEAAVLVQRAGSEYVAALAQFVTLSSAASQEIRAQGREAALSAVYGAAKELVDLTPEDPRTASMLQAVSTTRRLSSRSAPSTLIDF